MSSEKVDYGPVIADLESKIATLQGMVVTLKALAGGSFAPAMLPTGVTISGLAAGVPVELPVGALVGKSLPEAIKLYLEAVKKKQTKEQIMAALKEGGFETMATDIGKAVSTALSRLKTSKEVLRFPDGWGLASLYPEAFRVRLSEHVAKATKKNKKRASGKKEASSKQAKKATSASVKATEVKAAEAPKGMEQRVQEHILGNPTRAFQAGELSKLMNVRVQTIAMLLGKMAHKGTIGRTGSGYHAPKQTTH